MLLTNYSTRWCPRSLLQIDSICANGYHYAINGEVILRHVKSVPTFFTVAEKLATIASTKNQLFAHRPTMRESNNRRIIQYALGCPLVKVTENLPVQHVFQRLQSVKPRRYQAGKPGDTSWWDSTNPSIGIVRGLDPGSWSISLSPFSWCMSIHNQWRRYIVHKPPADSVFVLLGYHQFFNIIPLNALVCNIVTL